MNLLLTELLGTILCFAGLFFLSLYRWRGLNRIEAGVAYLAERPNRSILTCFVVGFSVALFFSMAIRQPTPYVHDEHAYLLAADTYARGRLTNPTPPFPRHFASTHILVTPSYTAKYPPGQGAVLALGKKLGDPLIGLWFTAGLSAAVACWLLQGFAPQRWALLGGLLTALHPLIIKWGQSYWGGHVSFIGGAMVLGAAIRLAQTPSLRHSLLFGLGGFFLVSSRPFEGGLATLLCLGLTLRAIRTASIGVYLRRFLAPLAACGFLIFAWVGYYNYVVTGNPTKLPYMVYQQMYDPVPLFLFGKLTPIPPTLEHEAMRGVAVYWGIPSYRAQVKDVPGFLLASGEKIRLLGTAAVQLYDLSYYFLDAPSDQNPIFDALHWPLLLLLLGLPVALRRDPLTRYVALSLIVFVLALLSETYMHPHYAGPAGSFVLVLMVQSWRYLRTLRWKGKPTGLTLSRLLVVLIALSVVRTAFEFREAKWQIAKPDSRGIEQFLMERGEKHIVLVDHGRLYQGGGEWVYNSADLDSQTIIWARYLEPESNSQLLAHYADRKPWVLSVTGKGVAVRPYTAAKDENASAPDADAPSASVEAEGMQSGAESKSLP